MANGTVNTLALRMPLPNYKGELRSLGINHQSADKQPSDIGELAQVA
jgi:hypothetical protein